MMVLMALFTTFMTTPVLDLICPQAVSPCRAKLPLGEEDGLEGLELNASDSSAA
jgi:hypothetical protein